MTINKQKIAEWGVRTVVRAVKTGAQTAVALIGTNAVNVVSLDWAQIVGISATAMVVSVLTSIAGIPEVDGGASVFKIAKK